MVDVALRFGPAEYFALTVLAFVAVSAVLGDSMLHGLASLFFGLLLGSDRHRSADRRGRASPSASRSCSTASTSWSSRSACSRSARRSTPRRRRRQRRRDLPLRGSLWMTRDDWSRSWKPWLRGDADWLSARRAARRRRGDPDVPVVRARARLARDPDEFGHGAIEGVAGPEAANNAVGRRHAGAAADARPADIGDRRDPARRLPAVRSAARPAAVQRDRELVWGLIASLYIGNVMLLVLNLPLVGLWVRLLAIPRPVSTPAFSCSRALGAYSVNRSVIRRRTALRDRRRRLPDAAWRHPARARGDRPDPRTDGGTAAAPGAGDQPTARPWCS